MFRTATSTQISVPGPSPSVPAPRPSVPAPPPSERWQQVDPDVLTTLSDEITSLSARIAVETHRLLWLIAEFDRLEGWSREGFASCVDWLAYSTRVDKMTAREKVRVARALVRLPETSAAMARGDLSFSQARAITRVADAESETELLGQAAELSAAALERLVRSWRRSGMRDEAAEEARRHEGRCLSVFPDEDGSYVIRGKLDPEVGALLLRAIEAASDTLFRGSVPEVTPEQRRADALGLLAERAFAARFGECAEVGKSTGATPADRYLVVLHVGDEMTNKDGAIDDGSSDPTLPSLEDGTPVSAETSRRVACDASVSWRRPAGIEPAPSRLACGGRCNSETGGAGFLVAGPASPTPTTSDIGRTVGPPRWTTSCSSAESITDYFTKAASSWR